MSGEKRRPPWSGCCAHADHRAVAVPSALCVAQGDIIMAERISPRKAHQHLAADGNVLLVCAYDDEAEFHANYLDGAISLLEFESMVDALPRGRETIFYCACPDEQTSGTVADEYRAKGFTNVKVLAGGVKGWQRAGFNVPGAPVQ